MDVLRRNSFKGRKYPSLNSKIHQFLLVWYMSSQRQDLWSPSCQSCCRLTWTESPSSLSPWPDACRRLGAYGVWWPTLPWTMACKSRKRRWTMWSHRWLQEMPLGDWWFFVWCLGKGFFHIYVSSLLASVVGVLTSQWLAAWSPTFLSLPSAAGWMLFRKVCKKTWLRWILPLQW